MQPPRQQQQGRHRPRSGSAPAQEGGALGGKRGGALGGRGGRRRPKCSIGGGRLPPTDRGCSGDGSTGGSLGLASLHRPLPCPSSPSVTAVAQTGPHWQVPRPREPAPSRRRGPATACTARGTRRDPADPRRRRHRLFRHRPGTGCQCRRQWLRYRHLRLRHLYRLHRGRQGLHLGEGPCPRLPPPPLPPRSGGCGQSPRTRAASERSPGSGSVSGFKVHVSGFKVQGSGFRGLRNSRFGDGRGSAGAVQVRVASPCAGAVQVRVASPSAGAVQVRVPSPSAGGDGQEGGGVAAVPQACPTAVAMKTKLEHASATL